MTIRELHAVTPAQTDDILRLMEELNPDISVSPGMIQQAAAVPDTHFFVLEDGTCIVGCASLCVSFSPTGAKAGIEDVVVLHSYRGQGLGRQLMEHLIAFARAQLSPVSIHLTSRPSRKAANALYQALGFRPRETNVYTLDIF